MRQKASRCHDEHGDEQNDRCSGLRYAFLYSKLVLTQSTATATSHMPGGSCFVPSSKVERAKKSLDEGVLLSSV
jgi:hypothetical protein